MRRLLSLLLSLLYPLAVLLLLRYFAASIPRYAAILLKLYPFAVNLVLLITFWRSLLQGPSMVERFARLRRPDLPDAAVPYTRKVTQIWCLFFLGNGLLALGLALWASDSLWGLYTGLIAYVLMGLLLAGEWLVRPKYETAKS